MYHAFLIFPTWSLDQWWKQVVASYFSLSNTHPPLHPVLHKAQAPLFGVAGVKGQARKRRLAQSDTFRHSSGLNRSSRSLSPKINGPPCYLNTSWRRGGGARWLCGWCTQQPHFWRARQPWHLLFFFIAKFDPQPATSTQTIPFISAPSEL